MLSKWTIVVSNYVLVRIIRLINLKILINSNRGNANTTYILELKMLELAPNFIIKF